MVEELKKTPNKRRRKIEDRKKEPKEILDKKSKS